ncbi:3764_t:CDS:1, partial [Gigaspora margarita]
DGKDGEDKTKSSDSKSKDGVDSRDKDDVDSRGKDDVDSGGKDDAILELVTSIFINLIR